MPSPPTSSVTVPATPMKPVKMTWSRSTKPSSSREVEAAHGVDVVGMEAAAPRQARDHRTERGLGVGAGARVDDEDPRAVLAEAESRLGGRLRHEHEPVVGPIRVHVLPARLRVEDADHLEGHALDAQRACRRADDGTSNRSRAASQPSTATARRCSASLASKKRPAASRKRRSSGKRASVAVRSSRRTRPLRSTRTRSGDQYSVTTRVDELRVLALRDRGVVARRADRHAGAIAGKARRRDPGDHEDRRRGRSGRARRA